ncbi:Protein of unknown function [Gryllus bimaculatus]|nr:Protein of unknown function [Gryllus bimaculatus]
MQLATHSLAGKQRAGMQWMGKDPPPRTY